MHISFLYKLSSYVIVISTYILHFFSQQYSTYSPVYIVRGVSIIIGQLCFSSIEKK